MTRPALGCGLARVHVYDRSLVSQGTLTPADLAWSRSKSVDGASLSFSVSALDPTLGATPDMLEDALAIVELDVGGVWTPIGTPYVLSAGSGTVIGAAEGAAYEFQPVGVGAALGLCGEWLVLHSGGVVNRRGPQERYIGWQTESFDASAWTASPIVTTASLIITDPKYGEPYNWPEAAAAADWLQGDGTGPIILYRCGSFTVTTARKYLIGVSSDEEATWYLDGPGWGGPIITTTDQETGYMNKTVWGEVLQPGTYFLSAEMRTVVSAGGDGFDAVRFYVATASLKGVAETVVLMSDVACLVHNITTSDTRPGFTPDEVVEILRLENSTWGVESADLLTVVATDTMPDGQEWVWPVGTPVAQVLGDLEVQVSFRVDTSWNLKVSSDVTTGAGTVTLTEGAAVATSGMNIEGLGWTSDPVGGTRAVVLTNDGYVEAISASAELVVPARGMYLESGSSGSAAQGKAFALDAIAQAGRVRRAYQVDLAAVTGAVPEVNFGVGATATLPDYVKSPLSAQVVTISGNNLATRAAFTLEVGEV